MWGTVVVGSSLTCLAAGNHSAPAAAERRDALTSSVAALGGVQEILAHAI